MVLLVLLIVAIIYNNIINNNNIIIPYGMTCCNVTEHSLSVYYFTDQAAKNMTVLLRILEL